MGAIEQLEALARNLWWSWDTDATALWAELGGPEWTAGDHDPMRVLERLDADALTDEQRARVSDAANRLQAYVSGTAWSQEHAADLDQVAYLSMEFGLHHSIPLYSGGLGVLAGDHLKSASDLGVPLVGIGLLWREGYFRQAIVDGRQVARYPALDPERAALTRLDLKLQVPIGERTCHLNVWRLDVGRVPLYLLDADCDPNDEDLRKLTSRLYGGSLPRIQQEAILGLGAMRLLRALDLRPDAIHLNEGHCAFAPFQAAVDELEDAGSWEAACDRVRGRFVFTTHTPVPAGHDRFGWDAVNATLGPWRDFVGLPEGAFMDLGRVNPSDLDEPLCMTVVALRLAAATNGVSKLHGRVSREMWQGVYPDQAVDDVPIGHITNGVHPIFWVADPARALFDAHLPGWRDRPWDREIWAGVDAIDDDAIASMRSANRRHLIDLVERRTGTQLDPDRLTIGFARRFAPYKRGDLIFREPDRLAAWLEQGAQLVFAGKAHPADVRGQDIVARVVALAADPRFAGRVVLVPDYDIEVGQAITAGSDVWLNNPRRPHEASGTSGQKVVYNGGLNLSVLDGWWVEGFDGTNGWAIGDGREWSDVEAGDAADAAALYHLLEDEVWPTWSDPAKWIAMIRSCWKTCAPAFSSHRMVRDYTLDLYLPRVRAQRG